MLGHGAPVAVDVDRLASLLRELHGQLQREPVRGGEREGSLARDRVATGERLELAQPALERVAEALLLGLQHALDLVGVLDDLGVPRADLLDDDPRDAVDVLEADPARLHDGTADQPPHHVAAAFVRGRDPLRGQERHAAGVVGDHAVRLRRRRRRVVRDAGLLFDPVHDQTEAVRVEDRGRFLEQHGAALEAHPRVDVLLRQRRQRSVGVEVVLHEDEIPELDEPVAALAVRPAVVLAAAVLLAAVVVELGAGTARPRVPGRSPEVFGARKRDDPLARHALAQPPGDRDLVLAEAELRVAGEDRRPQAFGVELHVLGDELPGEVDRTVLEVVAEREVPEHLEHRRMARRQPDLVEVGVLAARAQDLLDGREARRGRVLLAGEVRLQRLHPGRDEERRGVLGRRDQRPRREAHVTSLLEEGEEALAQLCGRLHGSSVRPPSERSASWTAPPSAARTRRSCGEIGAHPAQLVTDPARLRGYARPRVAGGQSDFPTHGWGRRAVGLARTG